MTARSVAEGRNCSSDLDCQSQAGTKPSKAFCLLPNVDNSTWLMKVSYKSQKLPLLFLGHPYSLYYYSWFQKLLISDVMFIALC